MKKATLFTILFLYSFCFCLTAQEAKEYERLTKFTAASLIYTQYSTNSFESDLVKGKVTTSELKATLQYPLQFKEKGWTIVNGLNFILLSPKVEEEINALEIRRNFYTVAYHTAIIKDIGKKYWRATAFLQPTLASDFHDPFSAQDFIFQAAGFAEKRVNEFWEFGFGLSLNTRFGNEQLLPLLYYYRKKDKWETNVFVPSYIQQFYALKKGKIGISLAIDGNNYNFDNTVIPNLDLDKLSYSRVNIGPMYEIELWGDIYANIQGGVTIMNKQSWNNQLKEEILDLAPDDKLFFRVALKMLK